MRHFYVIRNWELRGVRLLPSCTTVCHVLVTETETCTPCIVVPLRNQITRHKDTQDSGSVLTRILTLALYATEW